MSTAQTLYSPIRDAPYCSLCELVVQAADSYLGQNATKAKINETVYSLCDALPAEFKATVCTLTWLSLCV